MRAPLWLKLAVGQQEALTGLCGCATDALHHGGVWAMATAFQNYLPDKEPAMKRVSQPALAIWGNSDGSHRATDRQSSLWLCDHPASRIAEYEDLGHFPELEDVERIYTEIRAFVADTSAD